MTTIKNARAASDLIQGNASEATPAALLARILDIEDCASDALEKLKQAEADAIAKAAAAAAAPAPDVQALAAQVAQLQAQLAKMPPATQTSA